jgi:hypothetical protein
MFINAVPRGRKPHKGGLALACSGSTNLIQGTLNFTALQNKQIKIALLPTTSLPDIDKIRLM